MRNRFDQQIALLNAHVPEMVGLTERAIESAGATVEILS